MTSKWVMSTEQIREYFKGSRVHWIEIFKNNLVPEDIIFEFQDRISSGDYGSRLQEIINMYARGNHQISNDMLNFILSKITINRLYDLEKVYDLPALLLTKSDEELSTFNMSYLVTSSLYQIKNISLQYLERVLSLPIDIDNKFGSVRSMLTNEISTVLPEVQKRAKQFLKESYLPSKMKSAVYGNGWIEDELFTIEEWVKQVPVKDIIYFFDTEYNSYSGKSKRITPEILEMYKKPEIVEMVVEKILERNSTVKNPKLDSKLWFWTKELIKDHPKFKEIEDTLMTDNERINSANISWNDVDTKIQDGKLDPELVEKILLRKDAPLWFTDKYQSKLLQMLVRKNSNDNSSAQFARHMNFYCQYGDNKDDNWICY